jgi:cytochrome c oxidase cbb3-type subunit III
MNRNKTIKTISAALPLLFLAAVAQAQEAADPYFYDRVFSSALVITAGIVLLGAVIALVNLLNVMVKMQQIRIYQEQGIEAYLEEVKKPASVSFWDRMYKKWTNVVPVEKEKDILMDHDYDGIRELDNSLPPWWVAMFYVTIAFGVLYFGYYHFIGAGPSSSEEYEIEMEQAERAVQAYLATQANLVDETNVTALAEESAIAAGEQIYQTNCAVCHGTQGEGGIGPNMTDEYWVHGGSIKDVFKVIKYGVPEKGMIAWKAQLSAGDMQRVASYILTLQGTNPPNAKEPEGERYVPEEAEEEAPEAAPAETLGMN